MLLRLCLEEERESTMAGWLGIISTYYHWCKLTRKCNRSLIRLLIVPALLLQSACIHGRGEAGPAPQQPPSRQSLSIYTSPSHPSAPSHAMAVKKEGHEVAGVDRRPGGLKKWPILCYIDKSGELKGGSKSVPLSPQP